METTRIVLLHGFLAGRAIWEPVLGELGGAAECLAPDLPGYGRNKGRGGDYSLDHLTRRIEPLLAADRPTLLVGHSMGAIISLALARRFPDRIAGIGVVGLPIFDDRRDGLAHLAPRGRAVRTFLQRDRAAHVACRAAHLTRRAWLPWVNRASLGRAHETLACTFDHDLAGHHGALSNIVFGGKVPELAAGLRVRVSALHGTEDRSAPFQRAEELSRRMGWSLRVAAGANHQVILEQPELVADWIAAELLRPGREDEPAAMSGRQIQSPGEPEKPQTTVR